MGKEHLVEGAKLICICGDKPGFLKIPVGHGYLSGIRKKANCEDCEERVNIPYFGSCKMNKDTHQCKGFMKLSEQWGSMALSKKKPEMIDGKEVLTMDSVLICKKGGLILPVTSGQGYDTVMDWMAFMMRYQKAVLWSAGRRLMCSVFGGDPINLNTGNFIYEKEDLIIPGRVKLSFRFFYNSMNKGLGGSMGEGYSHNHEIHVRSEQNKRFVYVCRGDGGEIPYKSSVGELYVPIMGDRGLLKKKEDGWLYVSEGGEEYTFDDKGLLAYKTDKNGNRDAYFHDVKGRLSKVEGACGGELCFTYNSEGKLIRVEDHTGRKAEFCYRYGKLWKYTNAAGYCYLYEYNENLKVESVTTPRGIQGVKNTYDSADRVVKQEMPDGGVIELLYDDINMRTYVKERNGSMTMYESDERFRNVKTVYEDGEEKFEYNDRNQRTLYVDKNGNQTRYRYDEEGRLIGIINALNEKTEFLHNRGGQFTGIKVCGKEIRRNEFNEEGKIVKIYDALKRVKALEYNDDGLIRRITQQDGSVIEIYYDEKKNIYKITDPYKGFISYEYDQLNRIIKVQNAENMIYQYQYNNINQVIKISDCNGNYKEFSYNESGKLSKIRDFDGNEISIFYDLSHNPVKVIDKGGVAMQYQYDKMGNLLIKTFPSGAMECNFYDNSNRLTRTEIRKSKDDSKPVTIIDYSYDCVGNLLKKTMGDETKVLTEISYKYDYLNRIIEMINPEGEKLVYQYDFLGNIVCVTDPLNNKNEFSYNLAGELLTVKNAKGKNRLYEYNLLGQIQILTDEAGRRISYQYLPGGRLKEVLYPNGRKISYTYDLAGRMKTKTDDAGNRLELLYDSKGRIQQVMNEKGVKKSYTYDSLDHILSMTDAGGNTTFYEYTSGGMLEKTKNSIGDQIQYIYDEADRLQSVVQKDLHNVEDRVTTYSRNSLGQIEYITDALGQKEIYEYDAIGRIISKIDRENNETKYSYTADHKVKSILYGDGREVILTYSPLRKLTGFKDWLGETKIERNQHGEPVCITDHRGNTVKHEWGNFGEKLSTLYPDGTKIGYSYDKLLRLNRMIRETGGKKPIQIFYHYGEDGKLSEKQMQGGLAIRWKYNPAGELIELCSTKGDDIVDRYSFAYDDMGNKTAIKKERQGLPEECGSYEYEYDKLCRLISVKKDDKELRQYTYDTFGNRSKMVDFVKGLQVNYSYNGLNQLLKVNTWEEEKERNTAYRYDKRGNMTEEYRKGELFRECLYDATNRLCRASNQLGEESVYLYNGIGQRVGNNSEEYLLDLTKPYNNLLGIKYEDRVQNYYWDYHVVAVENNKENIQYLLTDEMGSPSRLLYENGRGEVYGYDEFGNDLDDSMNNKFSNKYSLQGEVQPFGFTGYRFDKVSGSYFAQAREYQPDTGRFRSRDLDKFTNMSDILSTNLYIYGRNAPLTFIDDSGNEVIAVTGGIEDDATFKYTFVEPALKYVHDSIDGGTPTEDITWMVVNAGYTEKDVGNFQDTADSLGINLFLVDSKKNFVSYINNKDGGITRAEDKITDMSFFSHGQCPRYSGKNENQLSFTYEIEKLEQYMKEPIDFLQSDIGQLKKDAFNQAETYFYSCNTGTKDFDNQSFAQTWSNKTGGSSYAIVNGRSYYGAMNMAATSYYYMSQIGAFAPGEIWNKIFNTDLWKEKQVRKADRKEKGYSELGSLNYPSLVSWSGDMDVFFSTGIFDRGWKKFTPNEGCTD